MLYAGDEMGRTQRGNNNAYCQDNEISWLDWQRSVEQEDLLRFTKYVIEMRRNQPVLKRRRFFQGRSTREGAIKDITWFAPDGSEMSDGDVEQAMPARSAYGWTARRSTRPTRRATRSSATRSSCCSARTTNRSASRSLLARRRSSGSACSIPSDARWARRIACDAAHYELAARSVVVFRLAEPASNGGAA